MIRLQLENESKRRRAQEFERWTAANLQRYLSAAPKRHPIWEEMERYYPHFGYSYRYTDRDTENAIGQVQFLSQEELRDQYRLDVQMCREEAPEDRSRIAKFVHLNFREEKDAMAYQLSPREGREEFEQRADELLWEVGDDKENQAPNYFDEEMTSDEDFEM